MIWLYLIPLSFLIIVCIIAIITMIKIQKLSNKPFVRFEYQGQAYSLDRNKVYIIKTKRDVFVAEEIHIMSRFFESNRIKAIFVGVNELDDFNIELDLGKEVIK